jgi:transcriptional regulator with XRE-family HTH domain
VTTIEAMPHVDGERLRRVREERLSSHRELASMSGVSPTTVLNLKRREVEVQRRTYHKLPVLEATPAELVK